MKNILENWKKVTSEKYILEIVILELKLEFLDVAPHNETFAKNIVSKKIVLAHRKLTDF